MIPLFFMFNENIFRNMANINKIRISGTSYDIQDLNAPSVSAITQQEYDNLPSSAKTSNTFFVITDAQAVDLTNYYTKSETNTLLGGKQATLVSGTNIKTINNESILGSGNIDIQGGGKAIEAGRGIAITTGETADTVSFDLPISAGTGTNTVIMGGASTANGSNSLVVGSDNNLSSGSRNLVVGYNCKRSGAGGAVIGWGSESQGDYAVAFGNANYASIGSLVQGYYNKASGMTSFALGIGNSAHSQSSFALGEYIEARNYIEHSIGRYNVSNKVNETYGNSGNTLFSVGNGTSNNARHNAFEIRQNGDIYCNNGTSDVKLQEYLQIKAVKLTQSEYDSLSTYDSNTLYVIVN